MVYVLPSLAVGITLGNSINDESKIDNDESDDGEKEHQTTRMHKLKFNAIKNLLLQ